MAKGKIKEDERKNDGGKKTKLINYFIFKILFLIIQIHLHNYYWYFIRCISVANSNSLHDKHILLMCIC